MTTAGCASGQWGKIGPQACKPRSERQSVVNAGPAAADVREAYVDGDEDPTYGMAKYASTYGAGAVEEIEACASVAACLFSS
jgi:hypothetical protein